MHPEFLADAGSFILYPADTLYPFIPTMQEHAAQLEDNIISPIPIELQSGFR